MYRPFMPVDAYEHPPRWAQIETLSFGPIRLRKEWLGGPARNVYTAHSQALCDETRDYESTIMTTTDFSQLVSWCWAALLLGGPK